MAQFIPIALISLAGASLPGPDFALVTKNTLLHQRRAGIFSAIGIASAILIHMTYCLLGLAIVISHSLVAFSLVKYLGGAYLIYIGVRTLFEKQSDGLVTQSKTKTTLTAWQAWRQGFLCNLLNPKATLFFLAIFTVFIKPHTPLLVQCIYALELTVVPLVWFSALSMMLSHPLIMKKLTKAQKIVSKLLGASLIGFGVLLALMDR